MNDIKIDFVLPWVDCADQEWINDKRKYDMLEEKNIDNSECRYRDWDNLQYLFRGFEKFTPWVNKIHFITCGHLPNWLNTYHPKLNIVKHKDYIPAKFLPTFSVNPIELNLHRIHGLEEKFIYFNDDTFIIDYLYPEDFFKKGKPKDSAILNAHCYDMKDMVILTPFVDIGVINKYFNMHDVLKRDWRKWFNIKYGKYNIRNLVLAGCPRFPGMLQKHIPNAFLKSTFVELWEKEPELLIETCNHKFRHVLDVNQWLMKEWQLASGNFSPRVVDIGMSMYASEWERVIDYVVKRKNKFICINDKTMQGDMFHLSKEKINNAFEIIFPEKSEYEL